MEIIEIPFSCGETEEACVLAAVDLSKDCLTSYEHLLSHSELKKLESIHSEKRKQHFAFGRITTKKALSAINNTNCGDINIITEKSGCPIIENSQYCTSISHSGDIIASLVFKNKFSFGIDIEFLQENRIDALKRLILPSEKFSEDVITLTVVWTLKEALSKLLKSGFNVSFNEFEISKFDKSDKIFECEYKKHKDIIGLAMLNKDRIFALAFKKEYILKREAIPPI